MSRVLVLSPVDLANAERAGFTVEPYTDCGNAVPGLWILRKSGRQWGDLQGLNSYEVSAFLVGWQARHDESGGGQ